MLHTEPWLAPHCADTAAPCLVSPCRATSHLHVTAGTAGVIPPAPYLPLSPRAMLSGHSSTAQPCSALPAQLLAPSHPHGTFSHSAPRAGFSEHNYPSLWKHGNDIPKARG